MKYLRANYMYLITKRIISCLAPNERRQSLIVLASMVVMAISEMIGVASILPFITVLADPTVISRQPTLLWLYNTFGFSDLRPFLLALGLTSFATLIAAAIIRVISMFVQNRFIQRCRHTIGCRLLSCYLSQPYEFFLDRHTGDLAKNILSEVDLLVDRALVPLGTTVSLMLVLFAVVSLLLIVSPMTTMISALILIVAYVIIFRLTSRRLRKLGHIRSAENRARYETATEALGGVKAIMILGRESFYLNRFAKASNAVADAMSQSLILAQVPRYAIETMAFGGMILGAVAVLLMRGPEVGLGTLLPALALYAFAGYKMLPAVQGIYGAMASLQFSMTAVDTVAREFETLKRSYSFSPSDACPRLENQLELRGISYTYPNSSSGLRDVSFSLKRGQSLGVVGRTGSGKSTLVDVILGLLVPNDGHILVDGNVLTSESMRSWRGRIGYVPQDIFLADTTVSANIAFGVLEEEIDQEQVVISARSAQIHNFIMNELPLGYGTRLGERGVRLSGGQRQRIGIARALYRNPQFIILDEATSALDSLTEDEVMDAIRTLSGNRTVIAIAHRASTLKSCTKIIHLESGRIIGSSSGHHQVSRPH